MQAIHVTGYTDKNGNRKFRAVCCAGRVRVFADGELHRDEQPRAALRALLAKLDAECVRRQHPPHWCAMRWIEGGMPDGSIVFVSEQGAQA